MCGFAYISSSISVCISIAHAAGLIDELSDTCRAVVSAPAVQAYLLLRNKLYSCYGSTMRHGMTGVHYTSTV